GSSVLVVVGGKELVEGASPAVRGRAVTRGVVVFDQQAGRRLYGSDGVPEDPMTGPRSQRVRRDGTGLARGLDPVVEGCGQLARESRAERVDSGRARISLFAPRPVNRLVEEIGLERRPRHELLHRAVCAVEVVPVQLGIVEGVANTDGAGREEIDADALRREVGAGRIERTGGVSPI